MIANLPHCITAIKLADKLKGKSSYRIIIKQQRMPNFITQSLF